jgi:hypothetical protein
MDKNGVLTISNFQEGVADSPLLGFAKINNCELYEKKGVAKMQFGSVLSFSTASLPVAMVYDSLGNQYVGCKGGEFYKNGTLINTSNGICDLAIVTDGVIDPNGTYPIEYVLITRINDSLNFYGPTYSLASAFVGGYTGLATGHWKKIVVGIDISTNNTPYIYITNGNKIAAISSFTNAAPGLSPTYSLSTAALTLQPGYYAYTLGELGKFLTIGTHGEAGGSAGLQSTGNSNSKKASLVLWDRTSPSFNLPIYFKESCLSQMLQVQNKMYIGLGNRGRVLVTDSTNVSQIKRIPFCFNRQFGTVTINYPNAMTLHNGELLTGISTQGGSGDVNGNYGIYTINIASTDSSGNLNYSTNMRNSISTGYTGNTNSSPMQIGFLHSTGQDILYTGWQSGSTYGVDVISYPTATNFTSVIESKIYNLGNRLNPHSFKRMEISCANPLVSGQEIRISYRENQNDDYTTIDTYTSTDFNTENSINKPATKLAKLIDLQMLVEMTQPTNLTIGSNIELIAVQLLSSEK